MAVRRVAAARRALVVLAGLILISPPLVRAQTAASSADVATQPAQAAAEAAHDPQIDPAKLPVSLGRIRAQLAQAPPTKFAGLKIQETVEVVGIAPKQPLWKPEDAKLATGPVPWGAPTHKDFYLLNTPQEYRTPAIDINALVQWLLQVLNQKAE